MRSMVNEAKVTKRYNTGEYEFEEYTLGAVVDERDSGSDVLMELKKQINDAFVGVEYENEGGKKGRRNKQEQKEKKKDAKSNASKASDTDDENTDDEDTEIQNAGDDGESDQDHEAAEGEDGDDGDDSSDNAEDESGDGEEDGAEGDSEEDSEEDTKKAAKPTAKGKGAKAAKSPEKGGKKSFKKKPQSYSRGIEQHKEIFSGVLRSVAPDWKKTDAGKQKAKKASEALEGIAFLDEDGKVLDTFKNEVKKRMTSKGK